MKVLLDHDVPHDLRSRFPSDHEVVTADYQGWADYDDNDLLAAAEEEFAVLVTLDTNLAHQQNVHAREIGMVVVDVHPIVPGHLEKHIQVINRALPVAAESQSIVVVREGGTSLLGP